LTAYTDFAPQSHDNAGPKFGIRLYDAATTQTAHVLDSTVLSRFIVGFDGSESKSKRLEEPRACDLVHIPTPWHNCVARLKCSDGATETDMVRYFVVKKSVIDKALVKGLVAGGWDAVDGCFDIENLGASVETASGLSESVERPKAFCQAPTVDQ